MGQKSFKKDKSNFIFSFNRKEKSLPKKYNDSIYCNQDYVPVFGINKSDIALGPDTLDRGKCYKSGDNTFLSVRFIVNGDEYWKTKEVETYKIIYI